jgi:hypothetical protein
MSAKKTLQIVHTSSKSEAKSLRDQGYCPVEWICGTDGSIMDDLCMDHHGAESHREGVAIRAYRDHFGVRAEDPRFVTTGAADADMTFAIASLAGYLPHPSRQAEFDKSPPPVRANMTRDLTRFAELVNRIDVNPIGIRLEESDEGTVLLLWNQLSSSIQDATAVYSGVDRWRTLLAGRQLKSLLAGTKAEETERVALARQAKVQRVSDQIVLVESAAWGFDVWYGDHAPVVVALTPNQNVTIGCIDNEQAEELFGPDGLRNVYPALEPSGWGGRESVGGSPRGVKLTREQALVAANMASRFVWSDYHHAVWKALAVYSQAATVNGGEAPPDAVETYSAAYMAARLDSAATPRPRLWVQRDFSPYGEGLLTAKGTTGIGSLAEEDVRTLLALEDSTKSITPDSYQEVRPGDEILHVRPGQSGHCTIERVTVWVVKALLA